MAVFSLISALHLERGDFQFEKGQKQHRSFDFWGDEIFRLRKLEASSGLSISLVELVYCGRVAVDAHCDRAR